MTRLLPLALVIALAPSLSSAAPPRPLHYDRALAPADLEGRSLRELSILRNWPYAQAGQPFRKKWLRDYFSTLPWYHPVAIAEVKKIADLDTKNSAAVVKYEISISRAELQKRRAALAAGQRGELSAEEAAIELVLVNRALGGASKEETVAASDRSPLDDPSQLDKLITVDQLQNLSRRDLRVMRNMVYARRGRKFKSDVLQQYFDRMEWYSINPDYDDKMLSKTDQRNIKIIRSVEDSIGGPMSEDEQKKEEGWFSGA
jgi:hypothetical protein